MQPQQYGPFEFSGLAKRPKWNWPNGAKLAFWICPNVEVFHLNVAMPNDSQERPSGREAIPMVRQWAQRDYGNRVGIWRVMEVLEKHGIRASAATNSDMCSHMPVIVEEMLRLKWEIMAHGKTNTHRVNEIKPDEEQAYVKEVFDTFEEFTGKRPIGWLAPGLQETWNTLEFLLDNGCRYVSDWCNDDQPYRFNVGGRELINIPYSFETNDSAALWRQKQPMPEFERWIREAFDVLYEEGQQSARVMCISLHPFVIGQPNRIGSLDRALAYIKGHSDVWYATAREIMEAYLKAVPAGGAKQ